MRDFWIIELWATSRLSMEYLESLSDEELEVLYQERINESGR